MFTLVTHEYEYDRTLGTRKLSKEMHYIRLKGPSGAYFLQDGKLWTEDGKQVEMVPKWIAEMTNQLTPEGREVVGWGKKVDGSVRA
jgi:hypothetical protein